MAKNQQPREPIDDAEFFRLHMLYIMRKDPQRRSPERTESPLSLKPSMHGNQIVDYKTFRALVAAGKAREPVGR